MGIRACFWFGVRFGDRILLEGGGGGSRREGGLTGQAHGSQERGSIHWWMDFSRPEADVTTGQRLCWGDAETAVLVDPCLGLGIG